MVDKASDARKLPHGATGIEAGPLAIEFRRDKAVFLIKPSNEHFTVHAGNQSGVLDVHRTWTDEHGAVRHQTVFAMRHVHILPLLTELSPQLNGFPKLVRRLRVGWLARHGIGVVRGLEFGSDEDIGRVTRKNHRKRLVFEEARIRHYLRVPEYIDDIWDFSDGPFSMFKGNRRVGIAFKVTDRLGRARLFWFKVHDMIRFFNKIGPRVISTAQRFAIPQEKYYEYDVLAPSRRGDGP